MKRWAKRSLAMLLAVETALLVPLAYREYLRFIYTQTLAKWAAKGVPPNAVFIGDSVTAGGRGFN